MIMSNMEMASIALICPDIRYTPLELAPSYHWLVAEKHVSTHAKLVLKMVKTNQMSELNLLSVVLIYHQFCHKPIVLIS